MPTPVLLPLRHFTDHQVTLRLHYSPDRLAHVRRIVAALLSHWGLDDLVDDGVLVATELVGNVRHTENPSYELTLRRSESDLLIEVKDFGRTLPAIRTGPPDPDTSRDSGRGLPLVSALSAACGVTPLLDGKTVWAALQAGPQGNARMGDSAHRTFEVLSKS
ncbi:ATP-binding protein [Streptomyces sp. PSKA54]|uniref:ATP-binding protein n=1 Tax=Streptomyces himalayensis subsp. aureolus TaxID=2758039 RepID=A0A7W2CZ31_9ACTN|nr:ATP-binding protein [Streptomyces himalayensis]MBA4861505.1 ATP-binding protein [Streptomyces himalayensis subsp. aureolus]